MDSPRSHQAGSHFPSLTEKFFHRHTDILNNLTQRHRRNITSFVEGDSCPATIRVSELLVRTTLADLDESQNFQPGYDFLRFEYGRFGRTQATWTV